MKKLFLLLIIPLNLWSQNPFRIDLKYKYYYNLINNAELSICNNEKNAAKAYYQAALKLDVTPFTKDIYNYMLISNELGDSILTDNLKNQLRKRGHAFSNDLEPIKAVNDSIKNNSYFYQFIRFLTDKDQRARKDCPHYNEKCKDDIRKIDSVVYLEFKDYILKNGFPDDNVCIGNSIDGFPFYNLLIIHDRTYTWAWIDSLMIKALNEGKMHPQQYGSIIDRCEHNKPIEDVEFGSFWVIVKINDEYYIPKFRNYEKVNKNRMEIGLESFEDAFKKAKFQLKNSKYKMLYTELYSSRLNIGNQFQYLDFFTKIDIQD